ncbi:MAG: helix-turn-helix transcriptional regulator, partial [Streptosporangiales bacterium]
MRYTAGDGRRSARTLHPYGLVVHSGQWYVTGADPGIGEDRTFRLDRIADARTLPGSFEPPAGLDPAQRVLSGFAEAPYRHEVTLWIQGTVGQIRARLPASVAIVAEPPAAGRAEPETERWLRVELRAEQLDWLPPVLASLDRPFTIERPEEFRGLVAALADRLAASARAEPGSHLTGAGEPASGQNGVPDDADRGLSSRRGQGPAASRSPAYQADQDAGGAAGLVAWMMAECRPGPASWVVVMRMVVNPLASSRLRYSRAVR